jgi:hypothetical protein
VLRWNGRVWRKWKAPRFDSDDVLLSAVSADPAGGVWVVGSAWDDTAKIYQAIAAWWDGHAWNEITGQAGGSELHDVVGSLRDSGWAVGRSNGSSRTVRACTPPQAGVFGSAEPLPGLAGETELDTVSATDLALDDDPESPEADDLESDPAPNGSAASLPKVGKKAKKVKVKVGTLPKAVADSRIIARDVARPAGVYEDTGTYNAIVEDFDGDGVDDLFIGRHGRRGRLMLNRGAVFVEHTTLEMEPVDRHGCATADIDGSGLPDLYCAVGGKRGSGLKSNELWLDPGGPGPVEVASALGLSDPTGRGRLSAFLEVRKQRAVDLVVANTPTRVDGLPSLTRVFHANGKGSFRMRARPGLASHLGARALGEGDLDGDGREDLVLVTGGPQSPEPGGTRLYRNTRRGLVDVTRKMGIRSFDELDAELVDLNDDGKPDLVQLSEVKLKVSLQKRGRFKKVYERNLTAGRALASGDVNGDGRADLYLVRSHHDRNAADVMLVNRHGGRDWKSMLIPQVSGGAGEDAYAIDHDGNGLDDFLVLNGHNLRGPTQLVAFYRR